MKRAGASACCLFVVCLLVFLMPREVRSEEKPLQQVNLDNFEFEPRNWKFVGGQEFPGAKGSLTLDGQTVHAGKGAYRLEADFSGGGLYVGTWKDTTDLNLARVKELRFWLKLTNVSKIGLRIVDGSDQCHQKKSIPVKADGEWHEMVLQIPDLVGEEHWGGENDGKWHGIVKGFGINIGKDGIADATLKGSLWIDDVVVNVVPPDQPTPEK